MTCTLSLATLVVGGAIGVSPPIVSNFDASADGWLVRDLNCNNYAQVIGGGAITWFASGGNPGGYIRSTDPSGNCYTYEAPSAFVGDRTEYIDGRLAWSIRTNVADWLPGSVVILIGAGQVLVADVPQPTTNAWLRYGVMLSATNFRIGSASGAQATQAQLASTMANITAIRISAEFGSEAGEETVDLDSVTLQGPCIADLDGDGFVGATDLGILLGAWGEPGSIADFDGNNVVDAADLGILLGAWGPC
ncbi:MAG: laminin B domain-containing protein [Phycisphaerales bacterium]